MSDAWIRAGRAAVIVVGIIVAAISYTHIRDLALGYGGDWLTAPLLPLGIDGAVAAFTVFMHQASGLALWLSRFGLLVAIGMTVAFNTAYGAAFGVTGAVVWSSPAVLLVICIEVSVLMVRKPRPGVESAVRAGGLGGRSEAEQPAVTDAPARLPVAAAAPPGALPVVAGPVKPETVPAVVTVREPPPKTRKLTVKAEAAMRGKSERTIYRERKTARRLTKGDMVTANGNGKAR